MLLITVCAGYETLAVIILKGMREITANSHIRQVFLPVSGERAGHFNDLLAEAVLARIAALEQGIANTHGRIV